MKYLTADEHRQMVERLAAFPASLNGIHTHAEGPVYTSLMMCFLMHSKSAADSLLTLHKAQGNEWFPTTVGYLIVRSLFEIDVNAHYISLDPTTRSTQYVEFEHVIRKNTLEAIERHRTSANASWREGTQLMYTTEYAPRKAKIEADFGRVRPIFEDGKGRCATSWSGKSIYAMAKDVNHLEAYEIFYADLSSFTHVNVMMANRFLRLDGLKGVGPAWTQRADEFDVANVFRYAATFLTCFLEHFGRQFGIWDKQKIMECWAFHDAEGRKPT